jgi:hypothetical protein
MKTTIHLRLMKASLLLLLCAYLSVSASGGSSEHSSTETNSTDADTRSDDDKHESNSSTQIVDRGSRQHCSDFEQRVRQREDLEKKRDDITQGNWNVQFYKQHLMTFF